MVGPTDAFVFANFWITELLEGISADATTWIIPLEMAEKLPEIVPGTGKAARLILWDGQKPPEIVECTNNLQTGAIAGVRGVEGTTPQAWPAGTQIRSALTAEIITQALAAYFDVDELMTLHFLKLTGGTLTGQLHLPATATSDPATVAATKGYVDSTQGGSLPLTGGTMQGDIDMAGHRILALPAPVDAGEPMTKNQSDFNMQKAGTLVTPAGVPAYIANQAIIDMCGALQSVTADGGQNYTVAALTPGSEIGQGYCCRFVVNTPNLVNPNLTVNGVGPLRIFAGSGINTPANFFRPGMVYGVTLSGSGWLLHDVYEPLSDFVPGDVKHSMMAGDHGQWLFADGRLLQKVGRFAQLFAIVGTQWGPSDTNQFSLLDARGRVLVGRDTTLTRITVPECGINGAVLGSSGGTQSVILTESQIPDLSGTVDIPIGAGQHHHEIRYNVAPFSASGTGASYMTGITTLGSEQGQTSMNATLPQITTGTFVTTETLEQSHSNVQPCSIINIFVKF